MATKRDTGTSRPPDREPVLRETWMRKSMGGGRIASLVADTAGVAGLVCMGYPFHPVGKPDKLRVKQLQAIETPTLIAQGERDPFGNRPEVAGYKLSSTVKVHWLKDGDHSFRPRKASGTTEHQNLDAALDAIVAFADELPPWKKKRS